MALKHIPITCLVSRGSIIPSSIHLIFQNSKKLLPAGSKVWTTFFFYQLNHLFPSLCGHLVHFRRYLSLKLLSENDIQHSSQLLWTHYRTSTVWPTEQKPWMIRTPTHPVITSSIRSSNQNSNCWIINMVVHCYLELHY